MKYIFSFLVLLISLTIFSQRHLIGGKIGPTMENDLTITGEPRIGVILGATYDYQITPTFYTGADILFYQRGFKFTAVFGDDISPTQGFVATDYLYRHDYIYIPLKIGAKIGQKKAVYGITEINLFPGFIISDKLVRTKPRKVTQLNNKSFDLSFGGQLGVGIRLPRDLKLEFTLGVNGSILGDNYLEHIGVQFLTGLKYTFAKKE